MSQEKGSRLERELVNLLDDAGFAVMRAPASGSATGRDLPDVLAGNAEVFYAIEVKASGGDRIYLDGEEVASLVYFARNFGAKARIGVRFDSEDWYFFHPSDLHVTPSGNYRVKRDTARNDGISFTEFVDPEPVKDEDGSEEDLHPGWIRDVLAAVIQGDLSIDEGEDLIVDGY